MRRDIKLEPDERRDDNLRGRTEGTSLGRAITRKVLEGISVRSLGAEKVARLYSLFKGISGGQAEKKQKRKKALSKGSRAASEREKVQAGQKSGVPLHYPDLTFTNAHTGSIILLIGLPSYFGDVSLSSKRY
ncbi:hypothetical protein KM043_000754 [Ampulex compressa]|nr:hypothetical protein KM043_000754 [Ampulex compressa]